MATTITLPIKGARSKVELSGADRLFFKILIDGEVVKPRRGFWTIQMRNGTTSQLRTRGLIPGFQSLTLDGEKVFQFGEHAYRFERYIPFIAILLVIANPLLGMVAAIAMYFMNLGIVRNPNFPVGMRVALPIVNTAVVGIALWAAVSSLQPA